MNAPTHIQRTSPSRRRTSSLLLTFVVALFAAIMVLLVSVEKTNAQAQGQVWAWGDNQRGALGDGTTTPSSSPVQVSGLSDVKAIVGGEAYSLALKNDGSVWAWGRNNFGQLGDGTTTDRNTPVQVSDLSDVKAVAGGGLHSLALKNEGTVVAWGWNANGQLGNGTTTPSNTPVQVDNLTSVQAIAAGGGHSLALKNDGSVWAWGFNGYGQLGNGTTTPSNTPVQVGSLSGVQAIAAGEYYSLALKNDGSVLAWGLNGNGQLGDGSTNTQSNTPVQVSDLSGVQAISAGGYHSLALKNDGSVLAWGLNGNGQLGDGSTNTQSNTPVQVSDLSGVQAISAGGYHSLALKNDGSVLVWGWNWYGAPENSNIPVQVSGLSGVQVIAAGYTHSLAIGSFAAKEPYTWSGVLQPINGGTTTDRTDDTSIFKLGSTVPVKFKLTGDSAGIADATAKLYFTKIDNGIAGSQLEATPTAAATEGNLFRHDPGSPDTTSDDQYIFNWSTKDLTAGTYKLTVDLGDGTADNAQAINHVLVSLR